ncbi:SDR family NAD(P)-dependent oxidoreductase [Acidisoma cellulosilytica]|uniref:SDR family NAD(P)-dependent oxidoreductase n=1 Tax=Acidisoma cellulosilyticum TaxID=2802395 RepID=A0A963Z652_9PROT|nr:SDR family oxidoreductase [Acidisoma cellulosilyticum]MCB8883251.1 SDR family NAD(P)-dependent oxidoreductase [Acidisoma cellulosilyticum]
MPRQTLPRKTLPGKTLADAPVVIITGGSSGIGRCTAGVFARGGWRVGLIARGPAGLAAAAEDVRAVGGMVVVAVADVTDSAALTKAAGQIEATLGPVTAWVNAAGNGVYGRFSDVPEAEFRQVTEVTYLGTVNGTRAALSLMRPRNRGNIVNVCSGVVFHGLPLMTSYSGAKAAVRAFGQALRIELLFEKSRIRVSTVFPPAVNTPFFAHAISHMGWSARPVPPVYQPDVIARGIYLAARTGQPEMTISGTVACFALLSRLAPVWTGAVIRRLGVDGQRAADAAGDDAVPTVFKPSDRPSRVHGVFGAHARRWSLQMTLRRLFG